MIILGFSNS